MFHVRVLAPLLILIGVALLAGCTSTTPTSDNDSPSGETVIAAVNTNCPIMGKPVKDNGGRTDWNGQTIGFCCPKCIDKWEALSEEEKTSHLNDAGNADHSGHQGHADHTGH